MDNLSYASSIAQTRKGLAAASLIIGVVSILTLGLFLIGAILGLVFGLIALRRTQRHPQQYGGAGYAIAGITTSAVGIVSAGFSLVLIWGYIAMPIKIEGQAMMPTFHDGQRVIADKMVDEIKRGDIVVFWFPEDPSKSYIKRIIGLPEEQVRIEDGKPYINNAPLDEPYLSSEYRSSDTMETVNIRSHHYFVMGDNRRNSSDSRYWGLVPEKYIYAKIEQ